MVLARTVSRVAQPTGQRREYPVTLGWMSGEDLPFLRRGFSILVEDLRWDHELSHVVQESPPAELVVGDPVESQFLRQ